MAAPATFERALVPPAAKGPELAQSALHALRRGGGAAGLLLALRYVQARFVSVWGLLIAALLCPPEVFTEFAIYSALANFLAIGALLRFEAVFFQNSDPDRLARAFRLSLAAGGGFLALAGLAALAASMLGVVLAGYAALFVLSLAGRAALRLMTAEATAEGDFRAIGNTGLVQAVVQPGTMLALILPFGPSSLALFAADAIGHVVTACYLGWRRRLAFRKLAFQADWSVGELRRSARQWSAAPRLLLPSVLLSFSFSIAPLFALTFTTDPIFAAHVALAMRLLDVPTQMFGSVTMPLVMNSLRSRQGPARRRWARILTVGLVAVAGVLFAGVAGFALILDPWLEETQWQGIGTVMAILTLFYVGIALVSPLNEIGTLSRAPQHAMITNAVAAVAVVAIIAWFGRLSLPLLGVVGVVSLLRMGAHACLAWTGFGGAGRPGTIPQGSRI